MIYFVTNNAEYYRTSIDANIFKDIRILDEKQGKSLYYQLLGKQKNLAFDIEATDLDAYNLQPLLYGIGNRDKQFMFDWTVDSTDIFEHLKKYNKLLLGHNLKYDTKVISVHHNVQLTNLYDCMIVDQRLWMSSGYTWSYAELVKRYCGKAIIKSTRNDFIGADIKTFKLTTSHLYYLKGDLVDLFTIREKQITYIKKFKMQFLIYGIELPLVKVIAEAELDGFELDIEMWRDRLKKQIKEKFDLEVELDEEVRRLRDYKSANKLFKKIDPKITLGGNKYNNIRKHNPMYDIFNADGTTNQDNIFGEKASHRDITRVKKKVQYYPNNISYASKKDLVYICAGLEEPLPTPYDTVSVPQLDSKGKLVGRVDTYTVKEEFLERFILQRPDIITRKLLEGRIKHSKLEKSISTYGESFINKIHKTTGKIHTSFRQCFANTGRFQSGGGDNEPDKINYQNIPRGKEFRNAFTTDTTKYSIMSADYSGAELAVMASHAQDFRLIELSKGDMHSHMATKGWRAVYAYRARNIYKLATSNLSALTDAIRQEYSRLVELAKTYTVTKLLEDIRTAFKPMTFGIVYGMYAKKAGVTLNISKEEGQIMINVIKKEIPLTIKMVEKASADAERQGYVIINNRTNSRAWFPHLIKQLKGEITKETHFMQISEESSAARNMRIQGTQADFVKEVSVVLWKWFKKNKFDIRIISWVHDELVFKIPLELDGKSERFLEAKRNNTLPMFTFKGKEFESAPEAIKSIMIQTANKYLINVEIGVDAHVEPYWTK